jgi:diacylglycerol kinase (ATP)
VRRGCGAWRGSTIATYRSAALIYNPCAGRLRGARVALVERIASALTEAGHGVTIMPTGCPGDGTHLARNAVENGADLIISVGGDGTLNDVINGVAGKPVPVAILPAGTANVLAREVGIGTDPLRAARSVSSLVPRRIAIGLLRAEGEAPRYFVLMAGAGLDAHIVYNLNLPLKSRFGQFAYWVSASKELVRSQDEFEVTVNGVRRRCTFALASRTRRYAGWMQVARGASLMNNSFELVLFEGTATLGNYSRYFGAVLTGRLPVRGMHVLQAESIVFERDGVDVHVQVDGEYAGRLPARVDVVPDALTLLVPPEFTK